MVDVRAHAEQGQTRLMVSGSLDAEAIPILEEAISHYELPILIDMRHCTFMDVTGLRWLMRSPVNVTGVRHPALWRIQGWNTEQAVAG